MKIRNPILKILAGGILIAGSVGAAAAQTTENPEMRKNRMEIRRQIREVNNDKRELRRDRRGIRAEVRELRSDLRNGAGPGEVRADRREIRQTRRELKRDCRRTQAGTSGASSGYSRRPEKRTLVFPPTSAL